MSESSSDTESSCGWTVISHEGSDIETLGPDVVVDYDPEEAVGASAPEQPPSSRGRAPDVWHGDKLNGLVLIVLADEEAEEAEQSSLDATIKEDEAALEAEPGHQ
ncbi:cell cycle progression protein 1 isoform X1, partial [Tachysurus ichikawai]